MVEKVARAICEDIWRDPDDATGGCSPSGVQLYEGEKAWTSFEELARAAIEAMREPTQAMCDAMHEVPQSPFIGHEYVTMIDAALKQ